MRCKVCGTEVKENQRFCPTCGLLIDLSFSPFQNFEIQHETEKEEEPEFLKQQRIVQEEAEVQEGAGLQEETALQEELELRVEEELQEEFLEEIPGEIQEEGQKEGWGEALISNEQNNAAESLVESVVLDSESDSEPKTISEFIFEDLEEEEPFTNPTGSELAEIEAQEAGTEESVESLVNEVEEAVVEVAKDLSEESVEDALEDESEEPVEDESEDALEEPVEDESEDALEEPVEDSSEDASEEAVEDTLEAAPEDAIEDRSEEAGKEGEFTAFSEEKDLTDTAETIVDEAKPETGEAVEAKLAEEMAEEAEEEARVIAAFFGDREEDGETIAISEEMEEIAAVSPVDPLQEEYSAEEDEGVEEERILSLQEKRKEMEERLAFDGEIPDDPDDFREKASIPPTSLGEWKSGWKKWKKAAPLAIIPVLGISYLCYQNLPSVQYSNLLKQGASLVQEEKGEEALNLLEGISANLSKDSKYYLLLAEAYAKAGQHENGVKTLEEAKKLFPDNQEIQTALALLDPKVESDLEGESFSDAIEISLKSTAQKIIYSLSGGKEEIKQEEYLAPIKLSRNGNYTLSAYAEASDGTMGESYTKSFSISLDPEKYHLSQFVDGEGGKSYIDENGDRVRGWKEIEGKYYYFNEKGIMQSGFQDIDGERYYLNEDGTMQTGRLDLEGNTYFFDQDGHMIKDAWIDNVYYVGEDGVMLRNMENKEGIHFDEEGRRSFLATDLYAAHPDSIVVVESKKRKDQSSYYLFPAKVYYQKKNGRASGELAYETEIKVSKMAMMSYLDEDLPSITAKDAVSFLPTLSMQNIKQNKDGVITSFSFVLGERRR